MGRVLVVDDERSMREFLAICLKRAGHSVYVAENPQGALALLDTEPVDIVVTDLRMPNELDGLGLLDEIKRRGIDSDVIMVTAYATADTAISAMRRGAYDYLTKPFKVDEINAVIDRALEKRALVESNAALRQQVTGQYRLASLLGKSRAMKQVFDLIGKIHSTKTSILITGESGTGKELVARALHTEGNRRDKPFVAVNCGAIPDDLMESELFGHVRGAFTGAVADKPGLFQQASGGTLFLDEIGELSFNLQVKLLRVLQERVVKPVGDTKDHEIDVRVIAATNRELEAEVARGGFRQDLYYRLNVIEVRIPPLRQRSEDIPLLVEHFVRRYAAEQEKRIVAVSAEALAVLSAYDFPGNVRELENLIERAVTLTTGSRIEAAELPPLRTAAAAAQGRVAGRELEIPDEGFSLDQVLADYERAIIDRALDQSGGVRKKAATLLGVTFRSLRYRLKKLGFDGDGGDEDGPADLDGHLE